MLSISDTQAQLESLQGLDQAEQLARLATMSDDKRYAMDDLASSFRAQAGHAEDPHGPGGQTFCGTCGGLDEPTNERIDFYYHPVSATD
jgi:hypothetical protein